MFAAAGITAGITQRECTTNQQKRQTSNKAKAHSMYERAKDANDMDVSCAEFQHGGGGGIRRWTKQRKREYLDGGEGAVVMKWGEKAVTNYSRLRGGKSIGKWWC